MLNSAKAKSQEDSLNLIHDLLAKWFGSARIRIYEAGGGSMSYLRLHSLGAAAHITVVDIDETQLQNNGYAHQKILGDIQTYSFPPDSFDLVICYNVIEHLQFPDRAIRHFLDALAPNGLIFVAAPNPKSLSGLVTKCTPHWFHVWFYRVILRRAHAGQPGQPPFPVVYHRIVSPGELSAFCETLDLEAVYYSECESPRYREMLTTWPLLGNTSLRKS
jgi:SAM-dependent methyltransferase